MKQPNQSPESFEKREKRAPKVERGFQKETKERREVRLTEEALDRQEEQKQVAEELQKEFGSFETQSPRTLAPQKKALNMNPEQILDVIEIGTRDRWGNLEAQMEFAGAFMDS